MSRFVFLVCALVGLALPAAAQDGPFLLDAEAKAISLDTKVTPRAIVTFRDVVKGAYPDLDAKGVATQFLGGRAVPQAVAPEAAEPGTVEIDLKGATPASFATLKDGDRDYAAVLVGAMLIFAQVAPVYRHIDTVFVQTDPGGLPSLGDMLLLGSERPGLVVTNSHFNSQESFRDYSFLLLSEGRLVTAYEGPFLYSWRTQTEKCEEQSLAQDVTPLKLQPVRDSYANILFEVLETETCTAAGKDRIAKQIFPIRLVWDRQKHVYRGGSKKLADLNKRRMSGE